MPASFVYSCGFFTGAMIQTLKRNRPDAVLGLGQSSRQRIEVESSATNRKRVRASHRPKRISTNGPTHRRTTLEIKTGRQAGKSTDAGDYVCNYSMYVMLDHIAHEHLKILFAFVHIPHDYDWRKASRFVQRILRQCGERQR